MIQSTYKPFFLLLLVIAGSYSIWQWQATTDTASQDENYPWQAQQSYKPITADKYMVSSASPLASAAGAQMLARGGHAIDAIIAAQMVLNVVEPQSSGIGGGAFLLYYNAKNKHTQYFNGRESAPSAAHSKMFLDNTGKPKKFHDAVRGGLSVGTPGLLKMLKQVHDKYGTLAWEHLFQPAIKLARTGFAMEHKMHTILSELDYLVDSPAIAKMFFNQDGHPKAVAQLLTNQPLANAFTTIAQEGIAPFYTGNIANAIVKSIQTSAHNQGLLSKADLASYQVKTGALICAPYRNYKVCSMPVPSSGGIALLQILGMLAQFNLAALKPNSPASIHLIAEASKLAYADRNLYIADIANVPVKQLLDADYINQRAKLIKMHTASHKVSAGKLDITLGYAIDKSQIEMPSTTHISVIDAAGNAIAMTSSIEYFFGSTVMTNGFLLNNQLTDFSFIPQIDGVKVANRVAPHKQPRSSMSPTLVFDNQGKLIMNLGSPGGAKIIQFVLKAIIAHLDWQLDIAQAIALPNVIALGDKLYLEQDTNLEQLQTALTKLGHKVQIQRITSGINAITIENDKLQGSADPRRSGAAVGF